MDIIRELANEFNLSVKTVENTVALIDEGNTIPFIARYRKEVTGGLDDQLLRELFDKLGYYRNLQKRKEEVIESITESGNMSEEIQKKINSAKTLADVEDIYRPYKPKRKTKASIAKEKGLEPLASKILFQLPNYEPEQLAKEFVDEEKGVTDIESAITGASDIIAEMASDNADLRKILREYLLKNSMIESSSDSQEDTVYSMYYDYSEPVNKIPGHRVLALDRGEREKVLKINITCEKEKLQNIIVRKYVKGTNPCSEVVKNAVIDGLNRLILPSLEREIRSSLTDMASEQAIKVFALNLRHLLMQPPVKGCVALGLDPAYRTGCKIAVVDETGKVLHTTVIYPTPPQNKIEQSREVLKHLISKYGVKVIAIGNGTASRESEEFVADTLSEMKEKVAYMVISEAGASVYSASKLAAEEFPDFDVSLRSAVSIARRLQDPLAELVKIDPKAIGVGQYQHDMPKTRLGESLGGVVEDCVNTVGVDLNTASYSLLSYVAGINSTVAKNIVAYRQENGQFKSRKELMKVAKLGKKAFEQSAGFLRIAESKNVLDNTAVHPESYDVAMALLQRCGIDAESYKDGGFNGLKDKVEQIGVDELAKELKVGLPTLKDIVEELLKPGRDPRESLPPPLLRTGVLNLEDLKKGMILEGTVRNVIDFGAFVDIGVQEDGLVHISEMADRYIKHPSEIVKVGDVIKVRVIDVDVNRKRISLTIKNV